MRTILTSLPFLALSFVVSVAGCSSSSSTQGADGGDGINVVPGQCVLASDDVWHCGAGYGNFAQCPGGANGARDGMPCTYAGSCFECAYDGVAGAGCTCKVGDAGTSVWSCLPSETGCGP